MYQVFDHLISPVAKILDFVYYSPTEFSYPWAVGMSIAYPLLYYVLFLLLGCLATGWFPYWFMDPTKLSWAMVVLWFCVELAFYLGFDWAFVQVSKKASKRKAKRLLTEVCACLSNKLGNNYSLLRRFIRSSVALGPATFWGF